MKKNLKQKVIKAWVAIDEEGDLFCATISAFHPDTETAAAQISTANQIVPITITFTLPEGGKTQRK